MKIKVSKYRHKKTNAVYQFRASYEDIMVVIDDMGEYHSFDKDILEPAQEKEDDEWEITSDLCHIGDVLCVRIRDIDGEHRFRPVHNCSSLRYRILENGGLVIERKKQ